VVLAILAVGSAAALVKSRHNNDSDAPSALGPRPSATTSTPSTPKSAPPTPASPSPSPTDLASLYETVADGVIRIETTTCQGVWTGSGFLIAPDLVATVAHVVDGGTKIVLSDGSTSRVGTVVGFDRAHEVALVRTRGDFSGHIFKLADSPPRVGSTVAAIGFPLNEPRSLSRGTVSAVGRAGTVEGATLTDLIQTDAAINPGNSGGPLLDGTGRVLGLVESKRSDAEGIAFAVSAATAGPALARWQAAPDSGAMPAKNCDAQGGSDDISADVNVDSDHPDAEAIAETFRTYAEGINTGAYDTAYDMLSPRSKSGTSRHRFAQDEATSQLHDIHLTTVRSNPDGTDTARVAMTSVQEPKFGHNGQSCSNWHLTYTMVLGQTGWLIDRAVADHGTPTAC
jgi:S1-C subfamily serine protease